ncbi:MAG TPA: hypothetical protein VH500_14090 [Nitrososphaeraceae archaeon]
MLGNIKDRITANLTPRYKLLALKIIRECNEARFASSKEGPLIMYVKSLEERLQNIKPGEIIYNLDESEFCN